MLATFTQFCNTSILLSRLTHLYKSLFTHLLVKEVERKLLCLPFMFLIFCLLPLLLFCLLRIYERMFTLYGLVKTALPERSSTLKQQKCDNCQKTKSRAFYELSKCKHLFCFKCFNECTEFITCNCPYCSKRRHNICYICCGEKKA